MQRFILSGFRSSTINSVVCDALAGVVVYFYFKYVPFQAKCNVCVCMRPKQKCAAL